MKLGGKRLRPLLCLMGADLFGSVSEDAYKAAIAIELFHNFTLIHDDIMDEAPLRRGKPSVHQKYGTNGALLSGDVMLVQAYAQIGEITHPQKDKVLELFSHTAREVCEGQQLDMDLAGFNPDEVEMDHYLYMIILKTSVLLAASLKLGGILGNGKEQDLERLYAFGENLGIAFQIQDDYLDVFGDPEKFGKQTGGDILCNKKTFLLIRAFELANAKLKKEILYLLQVKDPQQKIGRMLEIYKACRLDEWAEEQKVQYISRARKELQQINVSTEKKERMEELLSTLLNREK